MQATLAVFLFLVAVFVGGPLAVLWRDNRGQCRFCGCMTDGPRDVCSDCYEKVKR
jgi:hypothetical protein